MADEIPQPTGLTTFNELLNAAKANIQFIFTAWLDLRKRDLPNDHGLILRIEVDTILSSWIGNDVYMNKVIFQRCKDNEDDPTAKRMLDIFEFLDDFGSGTLCAVVVSSRKETFNRPFFLIDFELLFGLNLNNLQNESLVGVVLAQFQTEEFARNAWEKGVINVTSWFFGEDPVYYTIYELSEVKELVVKMAVEQQFFVGDITRKADNPNQLGIGISPEDRSVFLGFILFAFENEDETSKTVQLHIEYLLCNRGRRGVGMTLVNLAIDRCQSRFPGFTISVFIEAKPNGIAPYFWLKKLNFELDESEAMPGVYLPAYKIYPKTSF